MSGHHGTLIGTDTLERHLDDPGWRIVDCRHDLANPDFGRAAYTDGHIPGAVFMHLDGDLSGPRNGVNGRHPLPEPERLAARLEALGIGDDTQVIAYDDAGGMFAARLWWLLRWMGHARVAVLDGGLHAWRKAARLLETEAPQPIPGRFTHRPVVHALAGTASAGELLEQLQQPDSAVLCVLDARSPDRYRGENETLDPIGGHIPGARNRFFRDNLDEDGRFKPAAVLRDEFLQLLDGLPPGGVVHQCGSGVTACHNLLAMEHAGLTGSRLYPGSWSEWCSDSNRPVATGSRP